MDIDAALTATAAADEAPAGTAAGGLIEAIVTPEQARVFINVLATTRYECYSGLYDVGRDVTATLRQKKKAKAKCKASEKGPKPEDVAAAAALEKSDAHGILLGLRNRIADNGEDPAKILEAAQDFLETAKPTEAPADDRTKFCVGDIVYYKELVVRITAYDAGTDTFTVVNTYNDRETEGIAASELTRDTGRSSRRRGADATAEASEITTAPTSPSANSNALELDDSGDGEVNKEAAADAEHPASGEDTSADANAEASEITNAPTSPSANSNALELDDSGDGEVNKEAAADAEQPDYTFEDGRTWKGQLDPNGLPIGFGRLTETDGNTRQCINMDNEGRELDGQLFIKDGREGFLKLYACSGEHQGTYELDFKRGGDETKTFVSAAEAYVLRQAGADFEQREDRARKERIAKTDAEAATRQPFNPTSQPLHGLYAWYEAMGPGFEAGNVFAISEGQYEFVTATGNDRVCIDTTEAEEVVQAEIDRQKKTAQTAQIVDAAHSESEQEQASESEDGSESEEEYGARGKTTPPSRNKSKRLQEAAEAAAKSPAVAGQRHVITKPKRDPSAAQKKMFAARSQVAKYKNLKGPLTESILDTLVTAGYGLKDANGDTITKDHYHECMRKQKNAQKKKEWAAKVSKEARAGYLPVLNVDKSTGPKRSCMQDAVIIGAKRVGASIDRKQLLKEVPPCKTKDTSFVKIEGSPCVKAAIDFEHVKVEGIKGGKEAALLSIEDGGVYLVMAHVIGAQNCNHAFVYDSTGIIPGPYLAHSGVVIDNRKDKPVYLIDAKDRASVDRKRKVLNDFFNTTHTTVLKVSRIINKQNPPPPVKAVAPDAQGINEYKRKQREEGQATGKYDLVGDSKVEEIDLTDSPPAKKMKATKALEDMTIDELQAEYKAKLNVIQVRGPGARDKAWLIDKIQGGLTVRAKRARDNKQGASGKRPRN